MICSRTCRHTHAHARRHTHTHARTHARRHTHTHAHTHAHTHTHTHRRTHARTHAHTHTHTQPPKHGKHSQRTQSTFTLTTLKPAAGLSGTACREKPNTCCTATYSHVVCLGKASGRREWQVSLCAVHAQPAPLLHTASFYPLCLPMCVLSGGQGVVHLGL